MGLSPIGLPRDPGHLRSSNLGECIPALPFCHRTLVAALPKPGYPKQIKHLGDHVRARRIDLGLRQLDVADRLGAEKDTVRNWEVGRTEPEIRFLPAVIAFLGYNPLPESNTPGGEIERRRLSLGWSQSQLADRAGVDPATIRRVEADTKGMARRSRTRIKTALGPTE